MSNKNREISKQKSKKEKKYFKDLTGAIIISVFYFLSIMVLECFDLNETSFQFLYHFVTKSEYGFFKVGKTLFLISTIIVTNINFLSIIITALNIKSIQEIRAKQKNDGYKTSIVELNKALIDSFSGDLDKKLEKIVVGLTLLIGFGVGICYLGFPQIENTVRHIVTFILNVETAIAMILVFINLHLNFVFYKKFNDKS